MTHPSTHPETHLQPNTSIINPVEEYANVSTPLMAQKPVQVVVNNEYNNVDLEEANNLAPVNQSRSNYQNISSPCQPENLNLSVNLEPSNRINIVKSPLSEYSNEYQNTGDDDEDSGNQTITNLKKSSVNTNSTTNNKETLVVAQLDLRPKHPQNLSGEYSHQSSSNKTCSPKSPKSKTMTMSSTSTMSNQFIVNENLLDSHLESSSPEFEKGRLQNINDEYEQVVDEVMSS